jgi:hypothetical protein
MHLPRYPVRLRPDACKYYATTRIGISMRFMAIGLPNLLLTRDGHADERTASVILPTGEPPRISRYSRLRLPLHFSANLA